MPAVVCAHITHDAMNELRIRVGGEAVAQINASNVIVALIDAQDVRGHIATAAHWLQDLITR